MPRVWKRVFNVAVISWHVIILTWSAALVVLLLTLHTSPIYLHALFFFFAFFLDRDTKLLPNYS